MSISSTKTLGMLPILPSIALEHDAIAHLAPEALEFTRIAQEQGLKAVLEWRDGPFRN